MKHVKFSIHMLSFTTLALYGVYRGEKDELYGQIRFEKDLLGT